MKQASSRGCVDAREPLAARPTSLQRSPPFWPERSRQLPKQLRGPPPPAPIAAKIDLPLLRPLLLERSDSIDASIAGLQPSPRNDREYQSARLMSMMTTMVIMTTGRRRRGRGASRCHGRRRRGSWGRCRYARIEGDGSPPGAPIVCGSRVLLDGPQIEVVDRINRRVAVVTPSIIA